MKIIMGSTHHLDTHTVVGSHYFRYYFLDKGFEVEYLSAPITLFHLLQIHNSDTIHRLKKSIRNNTYEKIPFSLIAPHSKFPFNSSMVVNLWSKFSNIGRSSCNVLYIDNLFYHSLIDTVEFQKLIFRIPDKFSAFPGYNSNLEKFVSKIINKADLIIVSSKIYCSELQKEYPESNFVHVPNGIDLKREAKSSKKLISGNFNKNLVYVGALENWFDTEMLVKLAKRFPDFGFHLIGDEDKILSKVSSIRNIICVGKIPHTEVVELLSNFDLGLILFSSEKHPELIKYINPLKLYEYSLAGLQTISSRWEEIEQIDSPAILASSFEEFEIAIEECVKSLPLDSRRKKELENFTNNNSWDNLLDEFFQPAFDLITNNKN